MKQAKLDLDLSTKKTHRREFLVDIDHVVLWAALFATIESHSPQAKTGRPLPLTQTILRIGFIHQ